ncbi:lytic transglycosylase domain-containing protein [Hyphomicrobium sp.]|uniref:lytic transglycosylase domain-containing protein n=1 Tax=Hyphomicrobium sp. TaxID=82 RepID=UPI002E3305C8|nr:lytic transglycosylase domain-containing protein [Hyphomicrobium sp.]HEX2840258.1 lytic transglycosylase domain-containing protein [Hyphomicrobium sp.]
MRASRIGGGAVLALLVAFAVPLTTGGFAAPLGEIPKPDKPSKAEREYTAKLDKAIAPLSSSKLSSGDAQRLRDAFKALASAKSDVAQANTLKGEIEDPVARKLVDWYRLRRGLGPAAEIRAFLDANPAWGDRTTLIQKLEEALFTDGGSSTEIKSYFATREPVNGVGFAALASAHLAEGNKDEARRMAAKAWREKALPANLEAGFLARFSSLLTPADHKWRLDRLLIEDIRWAGEKAQRAAIVRRVIPLLPAAEQKKANVRLSAFLGSKTARKDIEALPAERVPDWGLVFHRVQALRRAGKTDEAAKILLGAPTEEALIVAPDEWWVERRANAYEALKDGNPKLAYSLVRDAGPLGENPLKEQAFMAGWIALRYLKDPKTADKHFQTMRKVADGPLSRAKASYWLGRTAEARNDKAAANEFYRQALQDPDTFHALLARQKLEPGRLAITTSPPAVPSAEEVERFLNLDAAKAVVIAKNAGLDVSIMRSFFVQLRQNVKTEAESAMVAHLAEAVGDTQSAVRTAKYAIARGQNLYYYAYPVHPFPAYTPLRKPPETALLLGLARQETEFNTLIVSGAGAKGLLQVMTVTAKHVCHDYKIKCDIDRLLKDPSYNAMMASAYVGDRMDDFSGSYVLTLAGYNAGPGRARQWIREFGDPRNPKVDPIDWIERIPIQETREYVAKVLANTQIYRARLGEEQAALRLEEDLNRARMAARQPGENSDG